MLPIIVWNRDPMRQVSEGNLCWVSLSLSLSVSCSVLRSSLRGLIVGQSFKASRRTWGENVAFQPSPLPPQARATSPSCCVSVSGKSKMLHTTLCFSPLCGNPPPSLPPPGSSHLCAAGLDALTSLAELAWKSSLSDAIGLF